jgi:hypothetical protein
MKTTAIILALILGTMGNGARVCEGQDKIANTTQGITQ